MNIKCLIASVSFLLTLVPTATGAEVVVNPNMPGVYRLVNETFEATRELAQSTDQYPQLSTEHFDCYTNTIDMAATVCTSRDSKLRIVQLKEMNAVVFLLLFKDENGTVNSAELTTVGAAGDQHLATGESIRFFRPLEIQDFSQF